MDIKEKEGPMLARIDERTKLLLEKVNGLEQLIVTQYVTKDEFQPVKSVTFGLVSVICIGVLGALVALVLKH